MRAFTNDVTYLLNLDQRGEKLRVHTSLSKPLHHNSAWIGLELFLSLHNPPDIFADWYGKIVVP